MTLQLTTSQPVVAAVLPKLQYSREEAAEILGLSLRTVDRLSAEKRLPVRRVGRRVLFTQDALLAFTKRDHRKAVIQ